jgi:gamma-tubulin complex component 2
LAVPEKQGQGSSRPSTSQDHRPPPRPSSSTVRRPASAAGPSSSGFKQPVPPPVSSSSRLPLDRPEERQARHGKAPARVIDLEPPIQEVAALELEDEDLNTDEDRKLDGVPLEVQEAWICEDLIFVLQVRLSLQIPVRLSLWMQGVEGSLIRYDESYDPLDEDQRLQGARWKVDPSLGTSFLAVL